MARKDQFEFSRMMWGEIRNHLLSLRRHLALMESPRSNPALSLHLPAHPSTHANPANGSKRDYFDTFINTAQRSSGHAGEQGRIVLDQRDDYLVRLGRRATTFGWSVDEGGERTKCWEAAVTQDRGDDDLEDGNAEEKTGEDHREENESDQIAPLRRNSSLSVFHDLYELEDDYTTPPLTPGSRSGSHSRLPSLSSTTSTASAPHTRRTSLAPLTPSIASSTPFFSAAPNGDSGSDVDSLAESVLADQDRFGLFALLESIIEWPFNATPLHFPDEPTPDPTAKSPLISNTFRASPSSTPALSRSQSMLPLHSLKLSSLGEETGELKRLYRVKSQSDLAKRVREQVPDDAGEKENLGVAGYGAVLVDMLTGLGSFI